MRQDPGLPSLVCKPFERRLKHAIDFQNVISKTQQEFEESRTTEIRTKRLVDVSPSIQKLSKSRHRHFSKRDSNVTRLQFS